MVATGINMGVWHFVKCHIFVVTEGALRRNPPETKKMERMAY